MCAKRRRQRARTKIRVDNVRGKFAALTGRMSSKFFHSPRGDFRERISRALRENGF